MSRWGAEDIPLEDGCADAVLVGQAFHWFDAPAAVAEIARVLRPGGTLGSLGNLRDDARPWMRELAAIAGKDGLPEGFADELDAGATVASVERRDFRLEHRVDRDTLVALVSSWSSIASLDEPERRDLLRRIVDLWATHPQLASAEEASLLYRTEASRIHLTRPAAGDARPTGRGRR
jgi:SAM-dependent methyltransferase